MFQESKNERAKSLRPNQERESRFLSFHKPRLTFKTSAFKAFNAVNYFDFTHGDIMASGNYKYHYNFNDQMAEWKWNFINFDFKRAFSFKLQEIQLGCSSDFIPMLSLLEVQQYN